MILGDIVVIILEYHMILGVTRTIRSGGSAHARMAHKT